jgi:hypothetical protein
VKFFFHAGDVGVVYVAAVEPFEKDWKASSVRELNGIEERSMGNQKGHVEKGERRKIQRKRHTHKGAECQETSV